MKQRCYVYIGTGCTLCFRRVGKMKEKGGWKEEFRNYNWTVAETFTVALSR